MVYCLVPRDLTDELDELLRRHLAGNPGIGVVVEQRAKERRASSDRRKSRPETAVRAIERRMIRAVAGRRLADRRATAVPTPPPELPRKVRAHADRLIFIERLMPSAQESEDLDATRLVFRIQSGEHAAFEFLYRCYFERVYSYVRLMLRDPHAVEDAVQQVFASLLTALPNYEYRGRPFRGWLFTIVRNQALAELRRQGRTEVVDPLQISQLRETETQRSVDTHSDAPVALDWITDRDLLIFVERLPLAQRQVLVLRYMLGLTHPEIAEVLARSHADVRVLHHRALDFLRARLAAVGRVPLDRDKARMRRVPKYAHVLRSRRYALIA